MTENHEIHQTKERVRLTTTIKRGTDTRDQDKHKLNVRGETPEEAAENLAEALQELQDRDVFKRTRWLGNE